MTIAVESLRSSSGKLSLEDYLAYDDGTDRRYELLDGVVVEMGAETRLNEKIALWLLKQFLQIVEVDLIARGTQIQVRSEWAKTRNPDLMILTEALDAALLESGQSLITLDMPPPLLVVEVVSPGDVGTQNYDRDYLEKPREYADRSIPEYWIIDPSRQVVLVLRLNGQDYERSVFRGSETVISTVLPKLDLNAAQCLGIALSKS